MQILSRLFLVEPGARDSLVWVGLGFQKDFFQLGELTVG